MSRGARSIRSKDYQGFGKFVETVAIEDDHKYIKYLYEHHAAQTATPAVAVSPFPSPPHATRQLASLLGRSKIQPYISPKNPSFVTWRQLKHWLEERPGVVNAVVNAAIGVPLPPPPAPSPPPPAAQDPPPPGYRAFTFGEVYREKRKEVGVEGVGTEKEPALPASWVWLMRAKEDENDRGLGEVEDELFDKLSEYLA